MKHVELGGLDPKMSELLSVAEHGRARGVTVTQDEIRTLRDEDRA